MPVFPRGDKFCARLYIRGKRVWLGSFETEAEAWQAFNEAKEARVAGSETCGQFADRWLDTYNRDSRTSTPRWSAYTIRSYRSHLKPFKARFGSTRLRELTIAMVRPWAATQPAGYIRVCAAMFADAKRDGLVAQNPFEKLRLTQSRGRRDLTPLTEPELVDLGETALAIHGAEYGPTARAILLTLGFTGIRPGELCALEPSDVDSRNMELHVRRAWNGLELKLPKNGQPRRVILPPAACEAIGRMIRPLHSSWLFTTRRGRQLGKGSLRYMWEPVRNAIGQPGLDLYTLRHAAATLLLERGVTPEDVAFQLGHTDGGRLVVQLYGHPSDEGRRDRLKRAFGQNITELASVKREAADG